MIGRAAQGRPWIFREIAHFLATGDALAAAARRRGAAAGCSSTCDDHYAPLRRVRPACAARASTSAGRCAALPGGEAFRAEMNAIEICDAQARAVADWFDALADAHADRMPAADATPATPTDAALNARRARMSKKHIEECVRDSLEGYFKDLRGVEPTAMYEMILRVVEKPLLEVVMAKAERQPEPGRRMAGHQPQHACAASCVEHKLIK